MKYKNVSHVDTITKYVDLRKRLIDMSSNHIDDLKTYGEKTQLYSRPRYVNEKLEDGTMSTCFALLSLLDSGKELSEIKEDIGQNKEKIFDEFKNQLMTNSTRWWYSFFDEPFDPYTSPFLLRYIIKYTEIDKHNAPIKFKEFLNDKMIVTALSEIIKNFKDEEHLGVIRFSDNHDVSGFLTYWNSLILLTFYEYLDDEKGISDHENFTVEKTEKDETDKRFVVFTDDDPYTETDPKKTIIVSSKTYPSKTNVKYILKSILTWTKDELYRQSTHFHNPSNDEADPVRSIFCLRMYNRFYGSHYKKHLQDLHLEPRNSTYVNTIIKDVFQKQQDFGLWKKYLPILAIPGNDGNAYPFALISLYELLMMTEPHGNTLPYFIKSIESAVDWIEQMRRTDVVYDKFENQNQFSGWRNPLSSNPKGHPECWSTALVYTSIYKIIEILDKQITKEVLAELRGQYNDKKNGCSFLSVPDSRVLHDGKKHSFKEIMISMIEPRLATTKENWGTLPNSILIHGPPGTGKTSITKYVASVLGWSFVRIDTSNLLSQGINNAAKSISQIFFMLEHMTKTIILFDEIDESIRDRSDKTITLENRLFTNMMLTKLNDLADNKKIIYYIATNNLCDLDPAILREGRLDSIIYLDYYYHKILNHFITDDKEDKSTWKTCHLNKDLVDVFINLNENITKDLNMTKSTFYSILKQVKGHTSKATISDMIKKFQKSHIDILCEEKCDETDEETDEKMNFIADKSRISASLSLSNVSDSVDFGIIYDKFIEIFKNNGVNIKECNREIFS